MKIVGILFYSLTNIYIKINVQKNTELNFKLCRINYSIKQESRKDEF